MNTNEKRKLEALVISKLATKRKVYQQKRATEYKSLVSEVSFSVPQAVQDLVTQAEKIRAAFFVEKEKLTQKARALGYTLHLSGDSDDDVSAILEKMGKWVSGQYDYTYTEPSLLAHEAETNKVLATLDDVSSRYSIEIWSESTDMKNLFERFEKDVVKAGV